jgi:hypothetical protein
VNAYAQFPLQRIWGSGKSASADGMKWDLYPQNLMSEYHIRYGGYGGIGYYQGQASDLRPMASLAGERKHLIDCSERDGKIRCGEATASAFRHRQFGSLFTLCAE